MFNVAYQIKRFILQKSIGSGGFLAGWVMWKKKVKHINSPLNLLVHWATVNEKLKPCIYNLLMLGGRVPDLSTPVLIKCLLDHIWSEIQWIWVCIKSDIHNTIYNYSLFFGTHAPVYYSPLTFGNLLWRKCYLIKCSFFKTKAEDLVHKLERHFVK